jgi:hypothetical protein
MSPVSPWQASPYEDEANVLPMTYQYADHPSDQSRRQGPICRIFSEALQFPVGKWLLIGLIKLRLAQSVPEDEG